MKRGVAGILFVVGYSFNLVWLLWHNLIALRLPSGVSAMLPSICFHLLTGIAFGILATDRENRRAGLIGLAAAALAEGLSITHVILFALSVGISAVGRWSFDAIGLLVSLLSLLALVWLRTGIPRAMQLLMIIASGVSGIVMRIAWKVVLFRCGPAVNAELIMNFGRVAMMISAACCIIMIIGFTMQAAARCESEGHPTR